MITTNIAANINKGAVIMRAMRRLTTTLNAIKRLLVTEALKHSDQHEPVGEGDGTAWKQATSRAEVVIIFPTDALKELLNADSEAFEKIEKLIGRDKIADLFETASVFKPKANFRELLAEKIAPKVAERVLKLCTKDSDPKVTFRVL